MLVYSPFPPPPFTPPSTRVFIRLDIYICSKVSCFPPTVSSSSFKLINKYIGTKSDINLLVFVVNTIRMYMYIYIRDSRCVFDPKIEHAYVQMGMARV